MLAVHTNDYLFAQTMFQVHVAAIVEQRGSVELEISFLSKLISCRLAV